VRLTIADLGTIVGVWAHPDDEGYLSGGIMAMAVAAGQRVVCVTATRGEAADPDRWPPEKLARIRERELYECLHVLGDGRIEHRWLEFADGSCDAVDDEAGAAIVAAIAREVAADTLLTFGPDGMTGHPDHIAVSRWTAVAGRATGARVLFASNTQPFVDDWGRAGHEAGIMMGAELLPVAADHEIAVRVELDDEWLDRKERAMLAQASQVTDFRAQIGNERYRWLLSEEVFVQG
jgi:LmbE family N-acetylglucosaminyl deacetylase